MSFIRKLDFFQKISVDNITQPTLLGSFLSISAISIMIFLLLKEILNFFSLIIIKQSIVLQDKDVDSNLDVHFGINFPHVLCHFISVDQEYSVGNHWLDIRDTLRKLRLDRKGEIINDSLPNFSNRKKLIEALINSEG